MTGGQKLLTLLLLEGALLGAAAGGGIYWYRGRDKTPAQLKGCEEARGKLEAEGTRLRARGFLLEAEGGLQRGIPGVAFERVSRAQLLLQKPAPELMPAFDELIGLVLAGDDKAPGRLRALAERVLPPSPSDPALAARAPARAPAPKPEGPKPEGPKPATATAPPAAATPPPAAGSAAAAPLPAAAPAAPPPRAEAPAPAGREAAAREDAYRAILDAKTALLAGGAEAQGAIAKLARARVMLDEAGRGDVGPDVELALSAAKRKDEAKARAAIDSALGRLR